MVKKKKVVKKISEGVKVSKKIRERETTQLIWFFAIIIIVFLSFLIPYFYSQSLNKFEFDRITWIEEDYNGLKIYHGMFGVLTRPNLEFNVFLRVDPRKNDVPVEGELSNFNADGVISFSKEINDCRGEVSRVMLDLASFLKSGMGMETLEVATSDWETSTVENPYVDCSNGAEGKTVIMIEKGDESVIFRSPKNDFCYVIRVNSCNDLAPVEKFIVRTVKDFKESRKGWQV